ncbi:MAG: hypothetical protein U0805_00145 [Pirellulales bacterium]
MEHATLADLYELASVRNSQCISITMPTQSIGKAGRHDAARLRSLLSNAERRLLDRGVRTAQLRKLVDPLSDILQDHALWSGRRQGLAIFRSDKVLEIYRVHTPLEESLVIDRRFHIKRLLPAVDLHPPFFVLVLSRRRTRFLRGTWQGCEPIVLREVPADLEEAFSFEMAVRSEQVQWSTHVDYGRLAELFHGQIGHRESPKEEITEYFRMVAGAVEELLQDNPWPLFLAGVDYEISIFRSVASHLHIDDQSLSGNLDCASDDAIYERVLPLARRSYARLKSKALDALVDLARTDRASYDLEKIVPAAFQGQVDTLIVNPQQAEFGRFHPETNWVEFTSDRSPPQDLVEGAIEQTILHRGNVYAAGWEELPEECPMGAVFRF